MKKVTILPADVYVVVNKTIIDEKDRSAWLNSFKVNSGKILKIPIYANQISISPINNEIFIEENNKKFEKTAFLWQFLFFRIIFILIFNA